MTPVRGIWVDRKNILYSRPRRILYNYVSQHPGEREEEIVRATGLARERLEDHLKLLMKYGYLFRDREGGYRVSVTSPAR